MYLQVNALSEWIIGIYLQEITNNEREISIPREVTECGIDNFEFSVSELVQVNPDYSRATSALIFLLFKLNTLQTKIVKLWVSRSHGVMTVVCWLLHHDNEVVFSSQPSPMWYNSTNQKIGIRTAYESWIIISIKFLLILKSRWLINIFKTCLEIFLHLLWSNMSNMTDHVLANFKMRKRELTIQCPI